ncbi:MAG: hypothetical protein AAB733_00055 [Patescibacteria group bacterium]
MKKNTTLFFLAVIVVLIVVFGGLSLKGKKSLLRPSNTADDLPTNTSSDQTINITDIEVKDLDASLNALQTVEQDLQQPSLDVNLNIES